MTGLVAAAAEFSTRRPSPSPTRWGRARAASRVSNNNANRATTLAGSRRGQVGPGPARDGDRRSAPTCLRCGLVLVVRRRGGGDDDSPVPGSAGSSGRADRAILGGPLQSRRKHVVGSECTRDVSRRDLLLLLPAPWPALLSAYNALTGQIELGSTNFSWCSCCPTMRGVVHARIRDLTTYVLQQHANNNATMRRTVQAWREARGVQGVRERTLARARGRRRHRRARGDDARTVPSSADSGLTCPGSRGHHVCASPGGTLAGTAPFARHRLATRPIAGSVLLAGRGRGRDTRAWHIRSMAIADE